MTFIKITKRGNLFLIICLLLFYSSSSGQKIPKGSNAIKIFGVGFNQMANRLLDAGFMMDKTDSVLQTIQTAFKRWGDGPLEIMIYVRLKDSTAKMTGQIVNTNLIGMNYAGSRVSKESATFTIAYTNGNFKKAFTQMSDFAKTFNRPVEYIKQ